MRIKAKLLTIKKKILTILIRLESDFLAFLATLRVSKDESYVDIVEGLQVPDGMATDTPLHLHTLPDSLVVAVTQDVMIAKGHRIGVAPCHIVAQWFPLQCQLPGLDLCQC